jgi:diadenosine tetraphosphate (Ap4A) HIT family hydrolase
MNDCKFCDRIAHHDFAVANEHAVAFADSFPLTPGHTLVVPRLHAVDLFDLEVNQRAAVWALVDTVHDQVAAAHSPDGFNIGVNVREAAGQTIPHAHVHVIPRYTGDAADPRGGVRWVLPDKAAYWIQSPTTGPV